MINWVVTPFQFALMRRWSFGADKRPVPLVFGALFNPALEKSNLFRRQRFLGFGWRHELIAIGGNDARPEFTIGEFAGHDDVGFCFRFHIQTQLAFTAFFVRTMAGETFVGKDGSDIPIELHGIRQFFFAE